MDPYECHIEAHRIPAPTQLVSLVSRDCRNSYLRLPFAIFFFGTSPCFPPFNGRDLCVRWLFSSKVQLLLRPPPMRSPIMRLDRWRRWIQGELLPSARSCQCGAVGPHGWLIILFFQWEKFLDTPPKEMWPAGMPLLVTQLYPQTSKLAGS